MTQQLVTPRFLTKELVQRAANIAIETVFQLKPKRDDLHVVVLVPALEISPLEHRVEYVILLEESRGEPDEWEYPFDDIAMSKAIQLWYGFNDDRTDIMPHLLFAGDAPYWGGVRRHGLVVACSGVEPWYDKLISGMTADLIAAMGYHAWMHSEDKLSGQTFLLQA